MPSPAPLPPPDGADRGGSDGAGAPARSLVEWLRGRSDEQLADLIRLRPDLALPAAPDVAALAARAGVRSSTQRALDGLDAHALHVLESLVLAANDSDTVQGGVADGDRPGLDALAERALVWGEADLIHLAPSVREVLGPYPAGLGRPASTLFARVGDSALAPVLRALGLPPTPQPRAAGLVAERLADPTLVADALAGLDDDERGVLDRLAAGPPVGTLRVGPRDATSPPHRLAARGLLVFLDPQRVELPREVGLAVRAAANERAGTATRPGPGGASGPPTMRITEREPAELDRLGAIAVLDALRLVEALADSWSAQPPASLRSGGVGVRDLKRTARDLGTDEATAALLLETAWAAGLLNATSGQEPVFLPTEDYDAWRARPAPQRWTTIAAAWLAMTRQPSLVGERGERDRVISALGPDGERGTVPALRRQVLDLLAEAPPGAAPAARDQVLDRFAWQQPRRASGQLPLVRAVLGEADLLGVTAAGGLTGYTRTLLAGSAAAAEHALDRALPEPVDHLLVQPDLTLVVPGPPEPELGRELGLLADLESTGGASVYRITERSVRRALDAGRSAPELQAFLAARSRTPVPQALTYLIDDVARRHGVLRAGVASAYLRCADEALLARVLADRLVGRLRLHRIAPTVVVSDAPVTELLDALRAAGYAPAAETPDGGLVTLGVEPPRAPMRPAPRGITTRSTTGDAQLAELVRRMRAGDALAGADSRVQTIAREIPGVTSASTMELLRQAVREARVVWFGCAEADGRTTEHTLQPISLAAGMLRGYEQGRPGLAAYPVHRITAIRILDDDEEPAGAVDEP